MKKIIPLFLFLTISPVVVVAEGLQGASELPSFSLQDPAGKTHASGDFKDGVVIVATAPTLSNKSAQEGWSDSLTKAKKKSKAKLIFVEDMAAATFKKTALKRMKKEYKPGEEPILLIDNEGSLRQKLKIPENETVVLVYDKKRKLVDSIAEKPSAGAAARIWEKIN